MNSSQDNIKFEVIDENDGPVVINKPGQQQFQPNLNQPNLNQPNLNQPNLNEFKPIAIENSNNNFEKNIKEFIRVNKPKLYILTPCFGSLCFVNYVNCLMSTFIMFQNIGFPIQIEFCKGDSLVSRARNNLIAKAMSDLNATHFLFIDNDISWDPVDILKLILANKPLVGGIYPLKHYHWDRLTPNSENQHNTNVVQSWINKKNNSQLSGRISDTDTVQHNLLRYNINYLDNYLNIDNNLAKVKHLATGFMLIQRNLITKMSNAFPSTKYTDDVGFLEGSQNDFAYALFDCGVEDGHYFSEDWLFCSRWSKMGGSIYVDVSINLTHTGIEDYRGCYLSSVI